MLTACTYISSASSVTKCFDRPNGFYSLEEHTVENETPVPPRECYQSQSQDLHYRSLIREYCALSTVFDGSIRTYLRSLARIFSTHVLDPAWSRLTTTDLFSITLASADFSTCSNIGRAYLGGDPVHSGLRRSHIGVFVLRMKIAAETTEHVDGNIALMHESILVNMGEIYLSAC